MYSLKLVLSIALCASLVGTGLAQDPAPASPADQAAPLPADSGAGTLGLNDTLGGAGGPLGNSSFAAGLGNGTLPNGLANLIPGDMSSGQCMCPAPPSMPAGCPGAPPAAPPAGPTEGSQASPVPGAPTPDVPAAAPSPAPDASSPVSETPQVSGAGSGAFAGSAFVAASTLVLAILA